jgi:hypothetical protein
MRKSLYAVLCAVLVVSSLAVLPHKVSAATPFDQNNLINPAKFDDVNSMSQAQIQSFLAGFPSSCLANIQSADPTSYSTFTGSVPASKVIYDAAQFWGLNPQVILVTLEKEESLVSGGAGCASWRYTTAMGYDCPDSGACPAHVSNSGFSPQVMHAAWQLRFNEQRSIGNTAWDQDDAITYGGYMTRGTFARVGGGSAVFYDGTATIDGTTVTMENDATASLYTYTPHFHGNQNFDTIYGNWFGTPQLGCPSDVTMDSQVQRLYNPSTGEHMYTAYQCEADTLVLNGSGFQAEGAVFNDTPSGASGAVPVYRLYNPRINLHFWTTSQTEVNFATQNAGYVSEGIAFYSVNPSAPNIHPVYRLYNPRSLQHFYTTSQSEANTATASAGYVSEGIGFYVQ